MRDKLIELIDNNKACPYDFPCKECTYNDEPSCFSPRLADELIANGVTIGKDNNVITNADRIRAMSDEELAEFISCKMVESRLDLHPELLMAIRRKKLYYTLYWLKQPAEEKK